MALSKADELKSRVLMAKANIPFTKIASEFLKAYPIYDNEVYKVSLHNTLLLRHVNEEILLDLEKFSKTFK